MPTPVRTPLAPRLVLLAGVAMIVLAVSRMLPPTETALLQIVGGLTCLAATGWILIARRAASRKP